MLNKPISITSVGKNILSICFEKQRINIISINTLILSKLLIHNNKNTESTLWKKSIKKDINGRKNKTNSYLDLKRSLLAQYSCQTSLNRNMWNTKIKKPMENQKMVGRPPNLLPCLCRAITWCSWAGAEKKRSKL